MLNKKAKKKLKKINIKRTLISKFFVTLLSIFSITGVIIISYIGFYVFSFSNDEVPYDVKASKLHLTSLIYVNNEKEEPEEYSQVFAEENRIWVNFEDIPKAMKDSIIAIEDKRFEEHNGVDFFRTAGAMTTLITGKSSYGGSTLTQQLIKNLTEDNDVSLIRKSREIFRALNFEKEYSKDEILEAYLNVVNFGGNCSGVQAAASTYFGKNISECSIAECATIAGITQNPSANNPFYYPENNKKRRDIIIFEMYDQGKISEAEYKNALNESNNMDFSKDDYDDRTNSTNSGNGAIMNWYTEMVVKDIIEDLSVQYGIGKETARKMVYTQGLKIYSAMDKNAQDICESVRENSNIMGNDKRLEAGFMMMDLNGRILCNLGSKYEKTGNLLWDNSTATKRQPGSAIKPLSVYAPAIDLGLFNYSSIISDEKIPNFYGDKPGPNNYGNISYGDMPLQKCVQESTNVAAVRVLQRLTPQKSYNFMTNKLNFKYFDEKEDRSNLVGLSMSGLKGGATVKEMTAAFQIFGNGGIYNKPYSYFYVTDRNGKVLLDNRDRAGNRAISAETSTIMNRILRTVMTQGTGSRAGLDIPGWNVIGKTGTTDHYDSWFVGLSPYAVAGVWVGDKDCKADVADTRLAGKIWRSVMSKYLQGKKIKDYNYSSNIVEEYYSPTTGELVNKDTYPGALLGYYSKTNLPQRDDSYTEIKQEEEDKKEEDNNKDKVIDETTSLKKVEILKKDIQNKKSDDNTKKNINEQN